MRTDLEELRQVLGTCRIQAKSGRNVLRSLLPLLAEVETRLDELEARLEELDAKTAEPRRQSDGTDQDETRARAAA